MRPAKLYVHALVNRGVNSVRQVAQALRVQVGEVDERGAFQRRVRRQVQVVANEHRGAGHPVVFDPPRAIGENHDGCSRRRRGAHRVHHPSHTVVLVVVSACADDEGALAAR